MSDRASVRRAVGFAVGVVASLAALLVANLAGGENWSYLTFYATPLLLAFRAGREAPAASFIADGFFADLGLITGVVVFAIFAFARADLGDAEFTGLLMAALLAIFIPVFFLALMVPVVIAAGVHGLLHRRAST